VVTRVFPQDRSFIGALITALEQLIAAGRVPHHDAEVFCAAALARNA
jgi:hypothetical protein